MAITFRTARTCPARAGALGIPVFSDGFGDEGIDVDWDFLESVGFGGKLGEVRALPADGRVTVVVGLGDAEGVGVARLRRAAGALAFSARRHAVVATTLVGAAPSDLEPEAAARAVVEGMSLASYRFTRYKSDPEPPAIAKVALIGPGGKAVQSGIDLGVRVADAVCLARDLVNEPGGSLTPRVLAQAAVELAEREDLAVTVLDEADIAEARLGGLMGVNRGSEEPPRFIELTYEPDHAGEKPDEPPPSVALVGKGITFDAGGLSIKTSDGMSTMKNDMAGAAAVLGVMSALGAVRPHVRVSAYLPVTDNMLGGDATRPGDVLEIRNGKTVEVLNTDAEGRLVLADALSLASEAEPDAVVDIATLTGACNVALGPKVAGLMGTSDALTGQLRAAGRRTGETVWPLPLPEPYRKSLDSNVADMKNVGARWGGALIAGLFLREFVGDGIPWAHLDIAGTAFTDTDENIIRKGATGFGVRLLLDFLDNFETPTKA